jgi:DNA-binding MarR family transcriptional regulator
MKRILIEFVTTLDAMLKKMHTSLGDEAGVSNLTIAQLHYLDAVAGLGNPTISDIASSLQLSKASVTVAVNKLVTLGFVTKVQSSGDRRVYHVGLTPTAERLVKARDQAINEYVEFIRSALSEEDAKQFEAILTKLVRLFV